MRTTQLYSPPTAPINFSKSFYISCYYLINSTCLLFTHLFSWFFFTRPPVTNDAPLYVIRFPFFDPCRWPIVCSVSMVSLPNHRSTMKSRTQLRAGKISDGFLVVARRRPSAYCGPWPNLQKRTKTAVSTWNFCSPCPSRPVWTPSTPSVPLTSQNRCHRADAIWMNSGFVPLMIGGQVMHERQKGALCRAIECPQADPS